jgi:hypothetical protein
VKDQCRQDSKRNSLEPPLHLLLRTVLLSKPAAHQPVATLPQHLQPLGRIQRPTALAEVQMRVDLQQEEEDVAQENAQHHAFEVGGVHQPVEEEDEPWSTGEYQMR